MSQLYLSPLTLLSWDSDGIPAAKDIHAAEKQRLAELESSGGMTLFIRNRACSKDDIIKAFDSILSDDCLPYHIQVKRDAALLDFLETGVRPSKAHFMSREIYADVTFRRWLAPYFAAAFASFLKTSIDAQKPKDLVRLLRENIKVEAEYEEEAWKPLRRELLKATSFLELYYEEEYFVSSKERLNHIRQLGAVPFLQTVRLKPEHLFCDEMHEYTRLLNNITTRSNTDIPLTGYCIYHNLLNLKLEWSMEETCRGNKDGFPKYYVKKIRYVKCDGIPGRWAIPGKKNETGIRENELISSLCAYLGIFVISVAIRVCNSDSDKPNKPYNKPDYHYYHYNALPDDSKKRIDSIATRALAGEISLDSAVRIYNRKETIRRDTLTDKQNKQTDKKIK
jgi:hypothetical protein